MAAVNSSVASFVPGLIFRFGSFSFTAGDDGRLGTSHLETLTSGQIGSDPASNPPVGRKDASTVIPRDNVLRPGHDSLSSPGSITIRSDEGKTTPLGPTGFSAEHRLALGQDTGLRL